MGYKTTSLPRGSVLTAADRERLRGVIRSFRAVAVHNKCHTYSGAKNKCTEMSYSFIYSLRDIGILGKRFSCECLPSYPFQPPKGEYFSHDAVLVEDILIDWTARQFNAKAPFPFVSLLSTLKNNGGS